MTSFYVVVQYVPDPIANERLNVGVVAYDDQRVQCKFISDWKRARSFGHDSISHLTEFARDLYASCQPGGVPGRVIGPRRMTKPLVEDMVGTWTRTIQFTRPCASMLPVDELLEDMAPFFLRQPEPKRVKIWRNRAQAVAIVAQQIETDLAKQVGIEATQEVFKVGRDIPGRVGLHRFDLQIMNGHLLLAGQALSFEGPETASLRKDVHAAAWAFEDLRNGNPDAPLSAVLFPPLAPMETFHEATETFADLKVDVVMRDQLVPWSLKTATAAARAVEAHNAGHS